MTRPRRSTRIAAILSGALVVVLTAAASRVPWQASDPDAALLRLSWRVPALVLESCRTPTPDEGAGVPEHMQGARICEGEGLPWSLEVTVDGAVVVRDTVGPAGIRGDRPLYVLRNVTVEPGGHELATSFRPIFPAGDVPDSLASRALSLETFVELAPREVLLVTVDPERRQLVVREPIGPN